MIRRETKETSVSVDLAPGGDGTTEVRTGDEFLDHMVRTLGRYAGLGLRVRAEGDLRHHLVEDVAITLGLALREATPSACVRYAESTVPMDDALVQAVLDVGGRGHYAGRLPSALSEHFMRSLAINAEYTLHLRRIRGRDRHHVVEAAFKALGFALRRALEESGDAGVFSTKGAVRITRGQEV